jgi:hypothetical protein
MTGRSEEQLASEAIGWMLAVLRDDSEGSIAMAEGLTKREATTGLVVALRYAFRRLHADGVPLTWVVPRVTAALHGLVHRLAPDEEPAKGHALRIFDTMTAAGFSESPLAEDELGETPQVALLLLLTAFCVVLGEAYKMTSYEAGQALAKVFATARSPDG